MGFFGPKLFDVIDEQDAERLIDQHTDYKFRSLNVVMNTYDKKWYVYNRGVEVHFKHGNNAKPIGYDTLAQALLECNDANLEKWGIG